ncbi:hypothetical protein Emed_002663 [Eimeria media]
MGIALSLNKVLIDHVLSDALLSPAANTPVSAQFAADQPSLAASVAFSSSEEKVNNENECCLSDSTKGEAVKARRMHSSSKVWVPIALSLLVVTLLAPLCYRTSRVSGIKKGADSRRLAEGEDNSDEEDLAAFAYWENLCASLGSWAPIKDSPPGPRASPALVDEVLATLEEGLAESAALGMPGTSPNVPVYETLSGYEKSVHAAPFYEPSPFTGHQQLDVTWSGGYLMPPESRVNVPVFQQQQEEVGRKRHRPEGVGVEEPSASWKMPRLDLSSGQRIIQPLEAHHHYQWEAYRQAAPPGDLSQYPILFTDPLPEGVPPYPASLPSPHPSPPSSSSPVTPPQSQPAALATTTTTAAHTPETSSSPTEDKEKHPYVRIPRLLPGVVPMPLDVEAIFDKRGPQRHTYLLREAHEILVHRPILLQQDANYLVSLAELLANHMYHTMATDLTRESPYKATSLLARRFLIFDILYSASAALNADWPRQRWWKFLAERVPTEVDSDSYGKHSHAFYLALIEDMVEALRLFKKGERPHEESIISIKRRLFCSEHTTYYMKASCWNEWREDDKKS